jgi:hypothetical protein
MAWLPTLRRVRHADRDRLAERVDGHPRGVEWLEVLVADRVRMLKPAGSDYHGEWANRILAPTLKDLGGKIDADLLLGRIWKRSMTIAASCSLGRWCSKHRHRGPSSWRSHPKARKTAYRSSPTPDSSVPSRARSPIPGGSPTAWSSRT